MGKSRRGSKEISREQKLIHENSKLKRQVSALRKELARVDLDRYTNLKEVIDQHYQEDRAEEGKNILDKVKQEWACHQPNCLGYLEIFLYNKLDHTWYYRQCNVCPNRTKAKKWTSDVKGIQKDQKD